MISVIRDAAIAALVFAVVWTVLGQFKPQITQAISRPIPISYDI